MDNTTGTAIGRCYRRFLDGFPHLPELLVLTKKQYRVARGGIITNIPFPYLLHSTLADQDSWHGRISAP